MLSENKGCFVAFSMDAGICWQFWCLSLARNMTIVTASLPCLGGDRFLYGLIYEKKG